jgi:hypothetical protein
MFRFYNEQLCNCEVLKGHTVPCIYVAYGRMLLRTQRNSSSQIKFLREIYETAQQRMTIFLVTLSTCSLLFVK